MADLNVTNIRPTMADQVIDLVSEAEDVVVIGVGSGDLKVVTSVARGQLMLILEAAKAEVLGSYLEDVLEEG